jgi:hypothetical protein
MKTFNISPSAYSQIKKHLDPGACKKIAAIKLLRKEAKAGLKEAKEAIEKLQHDEFGGNYPHASRVASKIIVGPMIKRLIVDYGQGEVEVDLETMELRALMEMQSIGLDACGEILELVETLKAYAAGKKIGVISESR